MQNFLKWFTPVLAIGVAIFIITFLFSINSEDRYIDATKLSLPNKVETKKVTRNWLNHFADTKKLGYSYPVNEVYIKVDLNEKIIKTITYKLSASLLDPYQLFCLKEELNNHKLKYDLEKKSDKVDLVIYSKNKRKLDSLVNVLKNYQIVAAIKPFKEEIE